MIEAFLTNQVFVFYDLTPLSYASIDVNTDCSESFAMSIIML
jgi:hypothetical protein